MQQNVQIVEIFDENNFLDTTNEENQSATIHEHKYLCMNETSG